jgi:2-keto-4-pentenoate hydratase/2-oxohepta-3-ene-1,7-dioic acid hydratase in catechol pathway
MKLVSFRTPTGESSVGIVTDTGIIDAGGMIGIPPGVSPMRRLLLATEGGLSEALARVRGRVIPFDEVTIEPIVPDPGKIVAAPVNYVDHMREMQQDAHIDALGVFLKAPSAVIATGETVRLPYVDRRFDQEGELAVVIAKTATHVDAASALDYIAGYTMLLDMTMRGGEDRSTRKSFDTFSPIGPWLVTPDEAGSPEEMRLRCWVNGELRQDAQVSDLIWGVRELIAYVSSVMVLRPGDILTTGTPAGVGEVHDGDRIAVEITNLGRLEVSVSAQGAVICPTRGANRGPKPPETITPIPRR